MAQKPALGLELGPLLDARRRRLDLRELEPQQVEVALAGALALAQLGELAGEPGRLRVRRAVAVAELELLGAGEAVEDLELGRGEHQLAVLVLAVEGEQPRAERPQVARPRPSARR